jgi:glyoxylase-like metal-dependent hydrolase (beta-lactamase superfamily II)
MSGPDAELDLLLSGGESIRLSSGWVVKVLHLPGHSHGHIGVFDPKNNAAFIGDAVLHKTVPDIMGRPNEPPSYRYVDEYVATINDLGKLGLDYLFTGHFPEINGKEQIAKFLGESSEFACKLDGAITTSIKEVGGGNPVSMKQIVERVHEMTRNWPDESKYELAYPVSGHLERMVEKKQVIAERQKRNGMIAMTYELA